MIGMTQSEIVELFQSTHPRGVRRDAAGDAIKRANHFNPRTREGCDYDILTGESLVTHFNPRTREGCDARWGNAATH